VRVNASVFMFVVTHRGNNMLTLTGSTHTSEQKKEDILVN